MRIHRLRTDESERLFSSAAICRHLQPNLATPASMIASSSAVHMLRPWSEPRMHAPSSLETPVASAAVLVSAAGASISGGTHSGSTPDAMSSESIAERPSSESPSVCIFWRRCHRLRTASAVRPGRWAAIRGHCVPTRRTAARIARSSVFVQPILRRFCFSDVVPDSSSWSWSSSSTSDAPQRPSLGGGGGAAAGSSCSVLLFRLATGGSSGGSSGMASASTSLCRFECSRTR
mmetsp:Transcript_57779/g.158762  ORF Transcript_57779/g.158762 Transcript_57779/m.158762 type:complete len:233 (+) Transcript_57779:1093-1791(+)